MSANPRATNTIELEPGRHVAAWLVLALVCIGQFMVVLDASIVNVALPSIQHDLHFSSSGLQWVINAYTLTFAGFLLLGGRAADLFGRKKIFMVGLTVFTLRPACWVGWPRARRGSSAPGRCRASARRSWRRPP